MGLEETSSVAYNLGETQTQIFFSVLLFGHEDSAEILASEWQEEENFEVWNATISKYIQLAFSCVIEKLLIFYIYKI